MRTRAEVQRRWRERHPAVHREQVRKGNARSRALTRLGEMFPVERDALIEQETRKEFAE